MARELQSLIKTAKVVERSVHELVLKLESLEDSDDSAL